MGSIDKILASLTRIADDKRSQISQRYDEESQWLRREFDIVRTLILKNSPYNSNQYDFTTEDKGKMQVSSSSNRISDEPSKLVLTSESRQSNKRKSPETALNDVKFSPVAKKSSFEVVSNSIDYNKLRKDQLLEELNKLGIKHFTMKALKKDLVDALKLAITSQDIQSKKAQNDGVKKTLDMSIACNPVEPESKSTSTRKHSLLDEIRVLVSSDTSKKESEFVAPVSIKDEFEARQKRHRESQLIQQSLSSRNDSSQVFEEYNHGEIDMTMLVSPLKATSSSSSFEQDQDAVKDAESTEEDDPTSQTQPFELNGQDEPSYSPDKDTAVDIAAGEGSEVEPMTTLPVDKPNNLVSSQSSFLTFLDKGQPKKPVVQSLVAAKNAKLAEEKRLQEKKLEQERKTNKIASKPIVPAKSTAQVSKNEVKAVATGNPKKPGFISNFLGKKNTALPNLAPLNQNSKSNVATIISDQSVSQEVVPPPSFSSAFSPAKSEEKTIIVDITKVIDTVEILSPQPENVEVTTTSIESARILQPITVMAPAPTPEVKVNNVLTANNEAQSQDYDFDDDDSTGSGTDDDEEEEKEKKEKLIPEWARGTRLREALERQWGLDGSTPMDPDLIFPEVQTCNLEEIFGVKKGINRVYSQRTSSAHWEHDGISLTEKKTYQIQMGYMKPI